MRRYTSDEMDAFRKARCEEDARPVEPDAKFPRPSAAGMCGSSNYISERGSKTSWVHKKNGQSFRVNKYAGACQGCGCWVPAGMGVITGSKADDGSIKWGVHC